MSRWLVGVVEAPSYCLHTYGREKKQHKLQKGKNDATHGPEVTQGKSVVLLAGFNESKVDDENTQNKKKSIKRF